ncbi:hypothetical protein SUGI_0041440 [Cryptomeria japonica]|nr:hypothetical protein SUGI_0041440 [Cryptomeria japonica]
MCSYEVTSACDRYRFRRFIQSIQSCQLYTAVSVTGYLSLRSSSGPHRMYRYPHNRRYIPNGHITATVRTLASYTLPEEFTTYMKT